MERKRVWNFHQGSTTDWSLVLNYFRSVCTEVMLMLDEFFSSYTRVCGHVHMQRRKIIWFFYAVMMLAAESVVGWRQQDDSEVVWALRWLCGRAPSQSGPGGRGGQSFWFAPRLSESKRVGWSAHNHPMAKARLIPNSHLVHLVSVLLTSSCEALDKSVNHLGLGFPYLWTKEAGLDQGALMCFKRSCWSSRLDCYWRVVGETLFHHSVQMSPRTLSSVFFSCSFPDHPICLRLPLLPLCTWYSNMNL